MGWFSGAGKATAGAAGEGAGKAGAKAGAGAATSSGALVALASIPVIGSVIVGVLSAETAADALDKLLENPAALAVVGGIVLLMVMK
jgi:hypothetical protein